MFPGLMSLWQLASVKNGPRNLPLKFGQSQASIIWDSHQAQPSQGDVGLYGVHIINTRSASAFHLVGSAYRRRSSWFKLRSSSSSLQLLYHFCLVFMLSFFNIFFDCIFHIYFWFLLFCFQFYISVISHHSLAHPLHSCHIVAKLSSSLPVPVKSNFNWDLHYYHCIHDKLLLLLTHPDKYIWATSRLLRKLKFVMEALFNQTMSTS